MNSVRTIFYVRVVVLIWTLISTAVFLFIFSSSPSSDLVTTWFRVTALVSFGLDLAMLLTALPFARERARTPAEPLALAYTVLTGVGVVMSAFYLVDSIVRMHSDTLQTGVMLVDRVAFLATEICLWLALLHASDERPPSWWGHALYGALGVATVFRVTLMLLPVEMRLEWMHTPVGTAAPWVATLLYVAAQIILLVRLHHVADLPVRATNAATPTTGDAPTASLDDASPGRDIAIGAAWLVGGLIVTLVSYQAAASSSSGGRYLITTGPIAYGLIRLFRGLLRQGRT